MLGGSVQTVDIEGLRDISGNTESMGLKFDYQIWDTLSLNLSVYDFGEVEETYIDGNGDKIKDSIELNSINFGASYGVDLTESSILEFSVGASYWEVLFSEKDSFFSSSEFTDTEKGVSPYIGIGYKYFLGRSYSLGVDYLYSKIEYDIDSFSSEHEMNSFYINLAFHF